MFTRTHTVVWPRIRYTSSECWIHEACHKTHCHRMTVCYATGTHANISCQLSIVRSLRSLSVQRNKKKRRIADIPTDHSSVIHSVHSKSVDKQTDNYLVKLYVETFGCFFRSFLLLWFYFCLVFLWCVWSQAVWMLYALSSSPPSLHLVHHLAQTYRSACRRAMNEHWIWFIVSLFAPARVRSRACVCVSSWAESSKNCFCLKIQRKNNRRKRTLRNRNEWPTTDSVPCLLPDLPHRSLLACALYLPPCVYIYKIMQMPMWWNCFAKFWVLVCDHLCSCLYHLHQG